MADGGLLAKRRAGLKACGASSNTLDALLAYTENPLRFGHQPTLPDLPLTDEDHLSTWDGYVARASEQGAWPTLQSALVQLQFGVREGISQEDDYKAATRKGQPPPDREPTAQLHDPAGLNLSLHATPAGRIPIIEITDREDFIYLVRALTARNEPEPVPESMGACIVAGFNNWDRIHQHRREWKASNPMLNTDARWPEEFRRLAANKAAYQDRFVLLSSGPYSNLDASDLGLSPEDWLKRSMVLRRDHECSHYFTARALGSMRNNLLDELTADYVGIVAAMGHYDGNLARRAFGLEVEEGYRNGGRLENYRGSPPLDQNAFAVACALARRCIANLETFDRQYGPRDESSVGRFIAALTYMTLEEIAADDMALQLLHWMEHLDAQTSPQSH